MERRGPSYKKPVGDLCARKQPLDRYIVEPQHRRANDDQEEGDRNDLSDLKQRQYDNDCLSMLRVCTMSVKIYPILVSEGYAASIATEDIEYSAPDSMIMRMMG